MKLIRDELKKIKEARKKQAQPENVIKEDKKEVKKKGFFSRFKKQDFPISFCLGQFFSCSSAKDDKDNKQ